MNTGMLWWFDARSNLTLNQKVVEAALYFRRKYGKAPTLCLMNPQAVDDKGLVVEAPEQIKVTVKPWRSVMPSHMWIGVDEMPDYTLESVEANARQEREKVS